MTKPEILRGLLDPGIIAIIRADSSAHLVEAAEALLAGGVTAMEVTMTTPGALATISEIATRFAGKIFIGVGSVIDPGTAQEAIVAGAQFVVTPVTKPAVIAVCNELGKPIASGAFTPTEALLAHESGADFVKIFPSEFLGPAYIRSILAPLPMLRLIPTGGVTPATVGAFIQAGSVALGVGSSLVSRDILQTQNWPALTATARTFIAAIRAARA